MIPIAVTDITRHNQGYYVLALDKSIDEVYEENSSVENLRRTTQNE